MLNRPKILATRNIKIKREVIKTKLLVNITTIKILQNKVINIKRIIISHVMIILDIWIRELIKTKMIKK